MKRILIFILLFFTFSFSASAEEDFGQAELFSALPEEAQNFMNEYNITPDNAGALSLSPLSVLRGMWNIIMNELARPFRMFAALVGVILLSAIAEALRGSAGDSGSKASDAFAIVGVLAGAGLMITYVSDIVVRTAVTLHTGGTFLLTFVPIFAGIMAVAGQLTTASVFSVILLTAGQVFIYITSMFLTPLASVMLGVSAAGAVSPDLKVDALTQSIQKVIIWILGILVTLFVGLLSLQSFISTSADTVALRAAKFAVSSTVPFVGGAVGDALSSVRGSLNILRNTTGVFGIISGLAIVVPALVSVFAHKIALGMAASVSAVFNLPRLTALLKSGESVLNIIFALLFCFVLIVVISVGLMLLMWNGGA
jgi:stage III sporulation protein AE